MNYPPAEVTEFECKDTITINARHNFVFAYCNCGGILSGKLASKKIVCLDCCKEYVLEKQND